MPTATKNPKAGPTARAAGAYGCDCGESFATQPELKAHAKQFHGK